MKIEGTFFPSGSAPAENKVLVTKVATCRTNMKLQDSPRLNLENTVNLRTRGSDNQVFFLSFWQS